MSTGYTWFGCDLVTGQIIEELPVNADSLSTLIGAYSTASVSIPLPDAPASWPSATEPGRTLLVCSRDLDDVIVWGGMVTSRSGGSGTNLSLGLATLEAYLDRRFTPTRVYYGADEARIAEDLVLTTQWLGDGVDLLIDAPDTNALRDRTYEDSSDSTVYSDLVELSGVEGGPEWTISLRWNGEKTHVEKVFVLRKRLGVQRESPEAVFDFPGTVKAYEFSESFTREDGANEVQVFGDGEGPARPASAQWYSGIPGFPKFETRETRSGVVESATLDRHAEELLYMMRLGARTLTIEADADSAPLYLNGWGLGDTVALRVERSYRHPEGLWATGRVIGCDLDPRSGGTVSPIVLLDEPL
jgi:hypothetical protein